ncbi:DUF4282 domain-containing protein [Pelistega europaea]|uniref:DUF4282 domain-containing protein n=1 Tax=Pelistega europaea TaxID=106147 RepID=A0A7Y4LAS0_9BURK|nr:DUF4282 domain-containing protein [Pelistega europaea]NOL50149.1 DUF4282 domain-containing protein [Pelistega europaea]
MNFLGKLWRLDKFIAPSIILIVYRIHLVITVIGTVVYSFGFGAAMRLGAVGTILLFLLGILVILPLSILFIRIGYETVIAFFHNHDNLKAIREELEKANGTNSVKEIE